MKTASPMNICLADQAAAANPAQILRDPRAIALLLAASLTVMAAATISPALPGLQRQFPDTETNRLLVRLLVSAPSLSVVLTAWACGVFADRIGCRPLLLAGVGLFALSGSLGLVLHDLPALLASRAVLGIALAMIMTAQSALLGDYFSGGALHVLTGAQVAARNLGGFVFISFAGVLAIYSPRLPFAVYALPALLLPFFRRVVVEPRHDASAGGVAADEPGVWRVQILALAAAQMAVTMVFFVMPTQLPFFLEISGFASPGMAGAALGALMLAGGAAAILYPRLRAAIGDRRNWACGFAIMAAGFAVLVTGRTMLTTLTGCAAIGAGYALTTPGFVALSLAATPPGRRGWTGAMLTGSVFLGQFLSPFLSIPAISRWGWQTSGLGLAVGLGLIAASVAIASRIAAPR